MHMQTVGAYIMYSMQYAHWAYMMHTVLQDSMIQYVILYAGQLTQLTYRKNSGGLM